MADTITITLDEYVGLKMTECEMSHLQNNGVDNWEWYGEDSAGLFRLKRKVLGKILNRHPTEEDLTRFELMP